MPNRSQTIIDAPNSQRETLGSLTTVAALSAIACLVVVHRAILAGLLTVRLVRRNTSRANNSCQNRKQNFEIIFHRPSVAQDYRRGQRKSAAPNQCLHKFPNPSKNRVGVLN